MSGLARIQRVVVLQAVDLFAACNAEQILRISAIATERQFAAGESIFSKKEPAEALYCLVDGEVAITHTDGLAEVITPSMPFGVEDILSGRLRTADAAAVEASLVLSIDGEDFFDLIANNIEIVRALFRKILSDRAPEDIEAPQDTPS